MRKGTRAHKGVHWYKKEQGHKQVSEHRKARSCMIKSKCT